MEKSEFISRIGLEIWIWIEQLRMRSAEVSGAVSRLVELEGFLEGGPKKMLVVSSGEEPLIELAEMDKLILASGDKSENAEDAGDNDAGSDSRRMSGVPRYEKVKIEWLFIKSSEQNLAVKVDCDVKEVDCFQKG